MSSNLTQDQVTFLSGLSGGKSVGNKSYAKTLAWDDERYWTTRLTLIKLGMIQKGRGRGGSIMRTDVQVDLTPPPPPESEKPAVVKPVIPDLPSPPPAYTKLIKDDERDSSWLEGLKCPRCEQHEVFRIMGTAEFTVTEEGSDEFCGLEWSPESFISCPMCGMDGIVEAFQTIESEDDSNY